MPEIYQNMACSYNLVLRAYSWLGGPFVSSYVYCYSIISGYENIWFLWFILILILMLKVINAIAKNI